MVDSRVLPTFLSPLTTSSPSTSISVNPSSFPPPSTSGLTHFTMSMSLDFATNVGVSITGQTGTASTVAGPRSIRTLANAHHLDMTASGMNQDESARSLLDIERAQEGFVV